jgi:hypothetical protein
VPLSPLSIAVSTGAAIAGLAAGWLGVAWWLGPPAVQVVPPIAASGDRGAADAGADSACAPLRDQVDALAARVAAKAREVAVRRGQLALIGGVPNPWPDGFDAVAHEAALNEALAARVAELLPEDAHPIEARAHCDEDPCLLAVTAQGQSLEAIDRLIATEHDLFRTLGGARTGFVSGPANPGWTGISWRTDDADPAAGLRASVRAKRLVAQP